MSTSASPVSPASSISCGGPASWEILVADCVRGLPASCPRSPAVESDLQARLFDLRRRLVDRLARDYAPVDPAEAQGGGIVRTSEQDGDARGSEQAKGQRDRQTSGQTSEISSGPSPELALEDMLRHRLPPLSVKPGPFLPVFSAWRSAVIAILGLLAGSALAQGLIQGGLPLGAGMAVLCGMLGVGLALQAAHALVHAAGAGELALPWGMVSWKKIQRIFRWGLGAVVLLTLVRDFFSARDVLHELLAAVGAFLGLGQVLPLLTSIWGVLAWLVLFAFCLHRPLLLDRAAFMLRVEDAARHWWGGASAAAEALAEVAALRRDRKVKQWRQAGSDLYSFAAELPQTRREWLEDRLRLLGLEAPREQGCIIWEPALRDRYDILGHVEAGDRCYEDQPPLLEQGQLLRRGVLRKVRG